MTHPLPNPLAVEPFARPVAGAVALPGSKSLTNRAMLLGALCDGSVTLKGALFSEDTRIMAEALRHLGFTVDEIPAAGEIRVLGRGGEIPAAEAELFTGLAGTAARFLTALCAASARGVYRIDGTEQMRRRPMRGLLEALRAQGADIRCRGEDGFLPIEIRARGLSGGPVAVDARESSQILSALLMVAPLAKRGVVAKPQGAVRMPFVRMTLLQMAQFGLGDSWREGPDGSIEVRAGGYESPGAYVVEPDATTASYFAALPVAAGGSIRLDRLRTARESLQGDVHFLDILQQCGAEVAAAGDGITVSFARGAAARGVSRDFSRISDTFLTLAAIAPLLDGPTRIEGIGHTRLQESDRVAAAAAELRRLGQDVRESEDAIEIRPAPPRAGVTVDTHGDHRFAMSFAVLGSRDVRGDGRPWLSLADPECCAKTFPEFFDLLEAVRRQSQEY